VGADVHLEGLNLGADEPRLVSGYVVRRTARAGSVVQLGGHSDAWLVGSEERGKMRNNACSARKDASAAA